MGRPTKCTPAVIKKAAEAIRRGSKIEHAALYCGIDERQWYRWINKGEQGEEPYRQFRQAVKAAEGEGVQVNLDHILAAADGGSWQAAAWILERRHGYVKRTEITGKDGGPVKQDTTVQMSGLTTQQLAALADQRIAEQAQGEQDEPEAVGDGD